MLKAMGIAEDAAYLAAALPRHARHPDWADLAARDLGRIVIHHVNLATPKRLLVLGRAMLPLFGHGSAQAGQKPLPIELQDSSVPALVSFGPEHLLQTPRFRKLLWQGWLDWTGGVQ
jgi:DNA polymerase